MEKVKDTHIFWSIVILIIIRIFQAGKWVACVTIAGFIIAISDIIRNIYLANQDLVDEEEKVRYGTIFIGANILLGIATCLLLVNFTMEIEILYSSILIDEISLFTLLLTLSQKKILRKINNMIRKEKRRK